MKKRTTKLDRAVDEFAEAMKKRLRQKQREGFSGWDSSAISTRELYIRAEDSLKKSDRAGGDFAKHLVDAANLTMMVWYREKDLRRTIPPQNIEKENQ